MRAWILIATACELTEVVGRPAGDDDGGIAAATAPDGAGAVVTAARVDDDGDAPDVLAHDGVIPSADAGLPVDDAGGDASAVARADAATTTATGDPCGIVVAQVCDRLGLHVTALALRSPGGLFRFWDGLELAAEVGGCDPYVTIHPPAPPDRGEYAVEHYPCDDTPACSVSSPSPACSW